MKTRLRRNAFTLLVSLGAAFVLLGIVELVLRCLPGTYRVQIGDVVREIPSWAATQPNLAATIEGVKPGVSASQREARASFLEALGLFQEDPELNYKLRPNLRAEVINTFSPRAVDAGLRWTIDTNASGFRGPELLQGRRANVRRVVCIGGSATFGWGVEGTQAFPAQLQSMLDEREPERFEVFNLGSPGATSFQCALLMRHLRLYQPDLVVCNVGLNDQSLLAIEEKVLYQQNHSVIGWTASALSHLRLFRLVQATLSSWKHTDPKTITRVRRVALEDSRANVREIISYSQAFGCDLLFLEIPCFTNGVAQANDLSHDYGRIVRDLAREANLSVIDFDDLVMAAMRGGDAAQAIECRTEAIRKWTPKQVERWPELVFREDSSHPSSCGHRLIASALVKQVLSPMQPRAGHGGLHQQAGMESTPQASQR